MGGWKKEREERNFLKECITWHVIYLFVCQPSDDTFASAAPMVTSINLQPLPANHAGKVSLVIDQVRTLLRMLS